MVKMVASEICTLLMDGFSYIALLMVPGANHALQEVLFTMPDVDNVSQHVMENVLVQVSEYNFHNLILTLGIFAKFYTFFYCTL